MWITIKSFIYHNFGNDGDSTVVQAADCDVSEYDDSVLSVVTLHCLDFWLKNK